MIFWEKQKVLTALYEQTTNPVCEKYGLTQMEYDIIMFLHNNPQYKTASDIVKMRRLTKSHVSTGVNLLKNKGYIVAHYADGNKKSAILEIADEAKKLIADGEKAQLSFGHMLFDGFDESEINYCRNLFSKMCDNANKVLKNK